MRAFAHAAILALITLGYPTQAQTHFKFQKPNPFANERAMTIMFGDTQFASKACPGLSVDGDAVRKTLYEHGMEMMDVDPEAVEEMWLRQQALRGKERPGAPARPSSMPTGLTVGRSPVSSPAQSEPAGVLVFDGPRPQVLKLAGEAAERKAILSF